MSNTTITNSLVVVLLLSKVFIARTEALLTTSIVAIYRLISGKVGATVVVVVVVCGGGLDGRALEINRRV